jgi:hypothetical protein
MSISRPDLESQLKTLVSQRAFDQIRDLAVEVLGDRIVLRGEATSFYLKQLAQHAVLTTLPNVRVINVIKVPI